MVFRSRFRYWLYGWLAVVCCMMNSASAVLAAPSRASTDAEFLLEIDGITSGADVSIIASGYSQVGPITPAVFDSLHFVSIDSVPVADNTPTAIGLGQGFGLDAQTEVRTTPLSAGQSANLQIDMFGHLDLANHSAFDVTINFFYKREFFLRSILGDPLDSAISRGTFEAIGISHDTLGNVSDQFSRSFDQSASAGNFLNPEEKLNFNFLIPSGGTASFDLHATAYSEVSVVPEPSTLALLLVGTLGLIARRR